MYIELYIIIARCQRLRAECSYCVVFFVVALVILWRAPDFRTGLVASFTLVYLGAVFIYRQRRRPVAGTPRFARSTGARVCVTVRNHVSNIFNKLQVAGRAAAIVRAREAGLGDDPS